MTVFVFSVENRTDAEDNGRKSKTIIRAIDFPDVVFMSRVERNQSLYEGYVVVSGSMEPTIPVGSLIYSKPTDPALLLLEGWLLNEIGRRLKLRD